MLTGPYISKEVFETADMFFESMRNRGFSYNTTASVRKDLVCPRCGFRFSLVYARTFACQGCSEAVRGCPKVRCNKCDCEFFLRNSESVGDAVQERTLADHICTIMDNRSKEMGIVSNNR